ASRRARPRPGLGGGGSQGGGGEDVGVAGQVGGPAAVVGGAVADALPSGAVPIAVAVVELGAGAIRVLGDEADLDLAGTGLVGLELPAGADVPAEHDSIGRVVRQDPGPAALGAVFGRVDDVPTHAGLERGVGDRCAEAVVLLGLEGSELLG